MSNITTLTATVFTMTDNVISGTVTDAEIIDNHFEVKIAPDGKSVTLNLDLSSHNMAFGDLLEHMRQAITEIERDANRFYNEQ